VIEQGEKNQEAGLESKRARTSSDLGAAVKSPQNTGSQKKVPSSSKLIMEVVLPLKGGNQGRKQRGAEGKTRIIK
jgi:hypothetical protein